MIGAGIAFAAFAATGAAVALSLSSSAPHLDGLGAEIAAWVVTFLGAVGLAGWRGRA